MARPIQALLIGLLVLAATACQQIPTQELSQYRNAFAEVRQASEDILVDFAAAKENAEQQQKQNKLQKAKVASAETVLFSTELKQFDAKHADAVEVRRRALRTIDTFNNVLVTLAEGKSVEAVRSSAGGFVRAAGKFVTAAAGVAVPGLSEAADIVKTLAGEFEKARLRREFEKAVHKGAPIIDKMLAALIEERKDHITLRAIEADQRKLEIVGEMAATTASVLKLVEAHSAPAAVIPAGGNAPATPLELIEADLNAALKPAESVLAPQLPVVLRPSPAMPAFGAEQQSVAQLAIARVREQAVRFEANVAQYESLRSALNNYGIMLNKTRLALKALVKALDKPVDFDEASEELFEVAFRLKRDIEAFRAARKAAR